MIDRVIQRPFLLWQAEALAQAGDAEPEAPLPDEAGEIAPADREEALAAVAGAVAEERRRGPAPSPLEEERRDEEPPIERLAYFPRDAALSIAQSAIERYLAEHAAEMLTPVEEEETSEEEGEDGRRAAPATGAADLVLDIPDEAIPDEGVNEEGDETVRLAGAFEITDPGWISSAVAMGWRLLKKRHRFNDEPAPPQPLAGDARLVVVGDWASGIGRARRVAAQMRRAVEEAAAAGRQCHVIHLGDTYYSGWDFEYRRRFLPHWPVRAGEPHGSWSLSGNHDMYTGGHGYFEVLLAEERFRPFHRGSSWFSLENEDWQLLGLDSGWKEHDLHDGQAAWVGRKMTENPGRRTMLMSHHQPFSAFGGDGPKLKRRLRDVLAGDGIDAWLWGHEHRCVVYEPREGIANPRCIGHGGIPVYADKRQPPGVRWRLDQSFDAGIEEWALCGFAVLDLDGSSIAAKYVNEFGGVDYEETI
jgi:Calcineurin-like phosphoesterase